MKTITYYDRITRGTEHEDSLVITQFLKGMTGQTFSFLNFYKEIPVSYNAVLLDVENESAEFEVHEYQAKVITLEKQAVIRCHKKSPVPDDLLGEVFYINAAKKRVILTRFSYARIRSDLRRFVRVCLEGRRADACICFDDNNIPASVRDLSIGGIALAVAAPTGLAPDKTVRLLLKLEAYDNVSSNEIAVDCKVVRITGSNPPYICMIEFHPERHSQQALAYYINQRQVELIRELKELAT